MSCLEATGAALCTEDPGVTSPSAKHTHTHTHHHNFTAGAAGQWEELTFDSVLVEL